LRRKRKEEEERELHRVRKDVFRAIKAIYIEPCTSRPTSRELNESFGEEKDVERESFEALRRVTITRERLEKTLRDLQRQTALPTPTFVIISDYEEEK
jgi:hypothetical protein